MRVILQGSMRHFAAAELMALFAQYVHTGTFDADSGERRVRLFFSDGRIAWAEGTSGTDAQELMTDLVGWPDGNFTFLDALSLPDGVAAMSLDPVALAAEGARRVVENQKVLALYPDPQTFLRVVPQPQTEVISLRPEQFQILFTIGTGRSLAQLLTALGRSALDLYPAVHALQSAGLIEPAAPPPPPPPPPPRAREAVASPPPPPVKPAEPVAKAPEPSHAIPAPVPKAPEQPPPAAKSAAAPLDGTVKASDAVTRIEQIAPEPMPEHPFAKPPEVEDSDKTAVERPADEQPKGVKKKTTLRQRTSPIATLTTNEGMMFPLLEDESTIGRVKGNSVVIPDGSISSRHARIMRAADAFHIEDLGSRNGTFLNGDPIKESRPLKDNDIVRCGKVLLTFNIAAVADAKEVTQPEVPMPRRKTKG